MDASTSNTSHSIHDFHVGDRVRIGGLQNQSARQYNGQEGRVEEVLASSDRLRVRFTFNGAPRDVSVRSINLEKLAAAPVESRSSSGRRVPMPAATGENERVAIENNHLVVIQADGTRYTPPPQEWMSYVVVGLGAESPTFDLASSFARLDHLNESEDVAELQAAYFRGREQLAQNPEWGTFVRMMIDAVVNRFELT